MSDKIINGIAGADPGRSAGRPRSTCFSAADGVWDQAVGIL